MQQHGCLTLAAVVLGPLLGAWLLGRLRLRFVASLAGMAALALAALVVVLQVPEVTTRATGRDSAGPFDLAGLSHQLASWLAPKQPAPAPATKQPPVAGSTGERDALQRSDQELRMDREQFATLAAERQTMLDQLAKTNAELEAALAANVRTRQELGAMRGHLASLKASAAKPGTTASQLQADLDGERLAHIKTRNELRTLRDQLVSLEAARSKAADATTAAGLQISLESERVAHEKTRATLKALEERTAALDAAARRQDQELRRTTEELASARTDGQRWQARLLQIEAEMQRQTAAHRGAGEVQTALPSPPTPFSGTSPPAASPPAAEATSLKTAPESAATDSPPPETTAPVASVSPTTPTAPARPLAAAPLRSSLDAGLANSAFDLQLMAVPELVQGKPGSYYRIVCRETPGGKRLKFVSGGYSIAGGEARLAACVKALSSDVLSVIPAGVPKILYVQAFASRQGFARPQPIAASDEQLKALSYLARVGEAPIFASSPRQQTVASTFDNSHLPLLRAGSIADWVETFTKEAVSPVLLEGEFRDNGEEVSRSFDFIVYVKW